MLNGKITESRIKRKKVTGWLESGLQREGYIRKVMRLPFIRAFLAKSVFKLSTNKDLIIRLQSDFSLKRICGFTSIPSEATFSRRFDRLPKFHFMEQAMNLMVEKYHKDRIVGHIFRDSTAIPAREKPENTRQDISERPNMPKRKRGCPKKREIILPKEDPRLTKQLGQKASKSLKDLNKACTWGGKKNSKGKTHFWAGYKLHLDVTGILRSVTIVDPIVKTGNQKNKFDYAAFL